MEARITRAALLAAVLLVSMGAGYRTPNFVVMTQDPQFAAELGQAAEKYRAELAVSWLGHTLPNWAQPCPMTVQDGPNLGAGGATTFVFDQGEVFGWRMTIQGSRQRLLDSVLPHEITHMIFASHFRRPLPRWADEGGATSVEHASEKAKHTQMLIQFLRSNRGIAFNRMFAMKEYPRDIMPLYAQGYSLAEFLIQQGGRPKYVDFLADGLPVEQWSAAIKKHYGIDDLGALQNTWLAWVRQGSPLGRPPAAEPEKASPETLLAAGAKLPRPAPNLFYYIRNQGGRRAQPVDSSGPDPYLPGSTALALGSASAPQAAVASSGAAPAAASSVVAGGGWHAAGSRPSADTVAVAARPEASPPEPTRSEVARPQPVEKSRQIILEWGKPEVRPTAVPATSP